MELIYSSLLKFSMLRTTELPDLWKNDPTLLDLKVLLRVETSVEESLTEADSRSGGGLRNASLELNVSSSWDSMKDLYSNLQTLSYLSRLG